MAKTILNDPGMIAETVMDDLDIAMMKRSELDETNQEYWRRMERLQVLYDERMARAEILLKR